MLQEIQLTGRKTNISHSQLKNRNYKISISFSNENILMNPIYSRNKVNHLLAQNQTNKSHSTS